MDIITIFYGHSMANGDIKH